jgi:hypothetical protein
MSKIPSVEGLLQRLSNASHIKQPASLYKQYTQPKKLTYKKTTRKEHLSVSIERTDKKDVTTQCQETDISPVQLIKIQSYKLPNFIPAQTYAKPNGVVYAFAANSSQGTNFTINESRLMVIQSLLPGTGSHSENCSYFAIFNGNNGVGCASYLRDNFHKLLIQNSNFSTNPKLALHESVMAAEKDYCEKSDNELKDHSGACAVVALILGSRVIRHYLLCV